MARYVEPTSEELQMWKEWVAERPEGVKQMAERFDPWTLYKMKDSGKLVTLVSFEEDGTLTVSVSAQFNVVIFERNVFGVNPDNLEEADLPSEPGLAIVET